MNWCTRKSKTVSFEPVFEVAHAEVLTAVAVGALACAGAAEHKLRKRHAGLFLRGFALCAEVSVDDKQVFAC